MNKRSCCVSPDIGGRLSPLQMAAMAQVTHRSLAAACRQDGRRQIKNCYGRLAAKDAEFHRARHRLPPGRKPVNAGFRGIGWGGATLAGDFQRLYSVEIAVSWYCGGAHPDRYATALTFDLQTGRPLRSQTAFFHIGKWPSGRCRGCQSSLKYLKQAGDLRSGHFKMTILQRGRSFLGGDRY